MKKDLKLGNIFLDDSREAFMESLEDSVWPSLDNSNVFDVPLNAFLYHLINSFWAPLESFSHSSATLLPFSFYTSPSFSCGYIPKGSLDND